MGIRHCELRLLGLSLGLLTVIGSLGCGARSPFPDLEPCFGAGAKRSCQNDCGAGQQLCSNGYWQACTVAPKSRACANDCGNGTQICANNAWGECAVAPTMRDCTNTCGKGNQSCSDNKWTECQVDSVTLTCANNCGTGTQLCANNTMQSCIVADKVTDCTNDCGSGTKTCSSNKWSDCQVEHKDIACASVCGVGKKTCDNGTWTVCDAPQPLPPKLHATIRDFHNGVPSDFDRTDIQSTFDDRGFVKPLLGADDTPAYALSGASRTVQSAQTFNEWYHDISGVNVSLSLDLPLAAASDQPGLFVYQNHSFFPIDGQLFGNEGLEHNYSFTLATSANFTFVGNEKFTFTGDDDVFVFINRHLAIDLGGVHVAETATVDLAARAQEFEIVPGNRYVIHIFFAERHPVASDFVVETSIADIGACP